jgi:hypothetical protein
MAILHPFFATAADMAPGIVAIERAISLDYVKAGMFTTPDVIRYPSAIDLPNFGISPRGRSAGADSNYLIVTRGMAINVQEVAQRRGGVRYFIDHRTNPGVVFRPGGMFKQECLISGEVGTPLTDEVSLRVWRVFSKFFFRDFVRINLFRLGPEALQLLRSGFRLAQDVNFSREIDLSPSAIFLAEKE